MSDGSLIPTFLLSRFVRKHVTVALGGDGGDEIFAGYPMYFGHKMARVYDSIPRFLRAGLIEPIVNNLPVSTKNLSFDYKAKRFVAASKYDLVTRHHSWFGSFSIDAQNDLLIERRFGKHFRRYLQRREGFIKNHRRARRNRADAVSRYEFLYGGRYS